MPTAAKPTSQMSAWSGSFGKDYTERNPQTFAQVDALYERQYGVTRSALNDEFLGDLDRSLRILEVGANVGTQLQGLGQMGFENLYGIELQGDAVERAKNLTRGANLIQGNAFDIPFKDGYFDLVYTSGVLIHISPDDVGRALAEIDRCTSRYIWGLEYFAEAYTTVPYRGRKDLLWKTDFSRLYREQFPGLKLLKERRIPYLESDNVDAMFLLEKYRV